MMFDFLGEAEAADATRRAVIAAVADGAATADMARRGQTILTTTEMTGEILSKLEDGVPVAP